MGHIGVDPSPKMIFVARKKILLAEIHENHVIQFLCKERCACQKNRAVENQKSC